MKQVPLTYDWTYNHDYKGTLSSVEQHSNTQTNTQTNTSKQAYKVSGTLEEIDLEMLKRPDPILWNDEIILFEDELHDNGIATTIIKVRVMPTCFLCLMRYWLRVDGVMMTIRDCRVFHDYRRPYMIRDYQIRSETFESLGKCRLPTHSSYYSDPNIVASKLRLVHSSKDMITLNIPILIQSQNSITDSDKPTLPY